MRSRKLALARSSVGRPSRSRCLRLAILEDRAVPAATPLGDLNPGPVGSAPPESLTRTDFVPVSGTVVFAASDGVTRGLWKTDGTPSGSSLIRAFPAGIGELTDVGGTVFFNSGTELWKSDGTTANTVLVKSDIRGITQPVALNGLLFALTDNDADSHPELWTSDGTEAGTVEIREFPQAGSLTVALGRLFFTANQTADLKTEVWSSDGTVGGTALESTVFSPRLFPATGRLYILGWDLATETRTLWVRDAAGTRVAETFRDADRPVVVGEKLFLWARPSAYPGALRPLWVTDGTPGGIQLVSGFAGYETETVFGAPPNYGVWNGVLYFSACNRNESVAPVGTELWRSDGTTAGTYPLRNFNPGSSTFFPLRDFWGVDGTLFFRGYDVVDLYLPSFSSELWQTDGTAAGTMLAADLNPTGSSVPDLAGADGNGRLFFWANDGVHGPEPWVLSTRNDTDIDGVTEAVEAAGPNGGDGNYDGVPDSQQVNVTSLPNSFDASYVTLASPAATSLASVAAMPNPSPTDAPQVAFPIGHLNFTIAGLAAGAATTVTVFLPDDTAVDSYYKYGPTPGNPTPHWYNFAFDGSTGAEVFAGPDADADPERIVLHFVDGQRGDNDLTANGRVVDPGSLAATPTRTVRIDAKPGDAANRINLAGQGKIAVAILTTADFNAAQVDARTVVFANARAVQWAMEDIDRDGDLDLVLHFRIRDTILGQLYRQLIADDINQDGVLDSNSKRLQVSLTGFTQGRECFTGSDSVELGLSGQALRDLLDELAAAGAI